MLTSLVSTLTGTSVRCDTAMTGELTLTGRVLPIGGLREKSTAAWNAGIKRVIIPADNVSDLEELDPVIRASLLFIPVRKGIQVLQEALLREDISSASDSKRQSSCTKQTIPLQDNVHPPITARQTDT